jgi:hypothetical protein
VAQNNHSGLLRRRRRPAVERAKARRVSKCMPSPVAKARSVRSFSIPCQARNELLRQSPLAAAPTLPRATCAVPLPRERKLTKRNRGALPHVQHGFGLLPLQSDMCRRMARTRLLERASCAHRRVVHVPCRCRPCRAAARLACTPWRSRGAEAVHRRRMVERPRVHGTALCRQRRNHTGLNDDGAPA